MGAVPIQVAGRLTSNQIRGFWAAWAGWALDGMDSFIYALVLVPALRDLLPRSGIAASDRNVGFYGGILFAVFLTGWGGSLVWGPLADRFGRVRILMFTVLCYSLFTFLGCFAASVWQLGLFRLLAGVGIGGEWSMGGVFIAEEWPENRRVSGAAWMHTGYYLGTLLAALLNFFVGARYGWRALFAIGGTPALLLPFIRYGVSEPARWRKRAQGRNASNGIRALFSQEYRSRTTLNALFVLVSMVGLWAGSVYIPAAITLIAARERFSPVASARLASFTTVLLSAGTILGCVAVPFLAGRLGRRGGLACFYALMAVFIPLGFGYFFYVPAHPLTAFMACAFWIGIGGASFCIFTVWLPEQYRTDCRASAFAFATSIGRFITAAATFLVGAAIARVGTLGVPVACTGVAFIIGLALLPWGEETRGRPLPD